MMDTNTAAEEVAHALDLRQAFVRACTQRTDVCRSEDARLPLVTSMSTKDRPFNRLSARSIVTCTALFSLAVQRSVLPSELAFSSHRFFEKMKQTTGSSFCFWR